METPNEINLLRAARWLWRVSRGNRLRIALCIVGGVVRVGISLTFIWLCKHLIDIATGDSTGSLAAGVVAMAVCVALQLAAGAMTSRLRVITDVHIRNSLRQNLLDHILKSRWEGRERYHSGDMLNRMEEDVATVSTLIGSSVPATAVTGVQLLGASAFLAVLDVRLALAVPVAMIAALLGSKLYMKRMRRLTREARATDSSIQSHIQESLQNRTLIATLGGTDTASANLGTLQSGLRDIIMSRNRISIFSSVLVQAGFATGYITAFSIGAYGIAAGTVSFGMMAAFLQLVAQVQRPIADLSRQVPAYINALTSVERISELASMPLEEQGKPVMLRRTAGLRMNDVSFTYADASIPAVTDFSNDFAPGSLTAVLGETGSGKSTLVRLMLALLRPTAGTVELYDGRQTVAASPLTRCNFVYVPQGNTLVSGTIRDNLLLGKPDATDREMMEALHCAAADFVATLPLGLDTPTGEKGAGLSEGQAQRVAIARGLLRPGSIVLLDEPTSALDTATEREFLQRLSASIKGKTLIIITHQAQTAALCDTIITLR